MIVSQADYDRWQAMYRGRNQEVSTDNSTKTEVANEIKKGHDIAAGTAKPAEENAAITDNKSPKSFLEEAFERLLYNRLGVDQERMDELKEEIEQTKKAIEAINNQQPHNDSQKKQLNQLQNKLEKLEEALKELLRRANERANEKNEFGQQSREKSAGLYQSISSYM